MSSSTWAVARCAGAAILMLGGMAWAQDAAPAPAMGERPGARSPAPGRVVRAHTERWLAVRINGTPIPDPVRVMQRADGELYATAEAFARWRIRAPAATPLSARGRDYLPLRAVSGLACEIDERSQTLEVRADASVFLPTTVHARGAAWSAPDPAAFGGFANYDLQYQQQEGARRLDGLFELGVFDRRGFGTTTFLARDVEGERSAVRLMTAWTHDQPADMRSLRVGDSASRPGAWGRAVHFGGLQWGTDFGIRPDLVTFPLPTVSGEALVPSTVDLYVDNALRLSRGVPAGPFTIPDVPVITGEGTVRVVVRDAFGREQVVVQPYYAGAGMLRPGLHDYTYEAGFIRRGFGARSNDYGDVLVTATHRAGLSERFTGELRAEAQAAQQAVGAAGAFLWPTVGVFNAALAVSHSRANGGGFVAAGVERQAWPLSFGYQVQLASTRFAQVGMAPGHAPPRRVSLARASYAAGAAGSISVSHLLRESRTEADVEFVSAAYNVALVRNVYLSVFALKSLVGERDYSVGVSLTHALGARTTASAEWNRQGRERAAPGVRLQQSLPAGPGVGYRVAANGGARPSHEAGLFLRGDTGNYGLEAAHLGDTDAQRLTASGGVAFLGGGPRLARRLDDSFAVVKVGDYPGVPVFVDNQLVAHTDDDGSALVPSLRAYQKNEISIGPEALPLDARLGASHISLTLARRSGNLAAFPVRAMRGALLKIVLDDGAPMPAGAVVRVKGQAEEFPVALRGEAYVTGITDDDQLEASWNGRSCAIRLRAPRDAGPLPVVGPLVCAGVVR